MLIATHRDITTLHYFSVPIIDIYYVILNIICAWCGEEVVCKIRVGLVVDSIASDE